MRLPLVLLFGAATLLLAAVALIGAPDPQDRSEDFGYAVRLHSEPWFYTDAELAEALDRAEAAGVNTIYTGVVWAAVDQEDWGGQRRTYDWTGLDRLVREAKARGMKVNFQLQTTPDWVHPYLAQEVPDKEDRKWYAPRGEAELDHFAAFVRDVAERYEGRVSHYEVWNEPNHTPFWRSGPDPAEYAALLRTAYTSLKATDPDARVVFGGLALNNLGYLREYYRVVESSYPDAADKDYFFDVLGVHPYSGEQSPDRYARAAIGPLDDGACAFIGEVEANACDFVGEVDANFLGFRRMKELVDAEEGNSRKTLFFGEFGYRTAPNGLQDDQRALFLKRAYELARETGYVEGMSWFTYYANGAADPPEWALLDENLKPSLTFRALEQVTGAEASTVRLGMNVTRVSPGTLSVGPRLTNLTASEVRRWELYVDGELVEQQDTAPIRWDAGAARSENQELMLAAYGADGSVWHSDIVTLGTGNESAGRTAPRTTS